VNINFQLIAAIFDMLLIWMSNNFVTCPILFSSCSWTQKTWCCHWNFLLTLSCLGVRCCHLRFLTFRFIEQCWPQHYRLFLTPKTWGRRCNFAPILLKTRDIGADRPAQLIATKCLGLKRVDVRYNSVYSLVYTFWRQEGTEHELYYSKLSEKNCHQ